MKKSMSIQRPIRWGLLLMVFIGAMGTAMWTWQSMQPQHGGWEDKPLEGLQILGTVPDFSLIERSGRPVGLADLRGKLWIVNFFYTNCPDTCPLQSAEMKKLQDEFQNEQGLRLVSITVDPQRDTPEVLGVYAERFAADLERWLFLTDEKATIYRLAQEGFHLAAVELPQEQRPASGATHTHSPRFVLLDHQAQIRGYYPSMDREALQRLRQDLRTLLQQKEVAEKQ
jgi:protein SCO1/2